MVEPTARAACDAQEQVLEDDRRDYGRYSLNQKYGVRLIARPSFQPFEGLLIEFSQKGIGLLLDRALAPGTVVALQLRSWHTGRSCTLSATVRHAQREGTSSYWRTGCSLSRGLDNDEIDSLLLNSQGDDSEFDELQK
jgi:hypothetical protein